MREALPLSQLSLGGADIMEHFRLVHQRLVFLDVKENRRASPVKRQYNGTLRSLHLLDEGSCVGTKLRKRAHIFGRSDLRHFHLGGERAWLVRKIVRQQVQNARGFACRLLQSRLRHSPRAADGLGCAAAPRGRGGDPRRPGRSPGPSLFPAPRRRELHGVLSGGEEGRVLNYGQTSRSAPEDRLPQLPA